MYIGVVGNIGTGKGPLTKLLADRFGWKMLTTPETDNPYLEDFYLDMERWALAEQVYFMTQHFKRTQQLYWSDEVYILDHTIYEDSHIYTANLLNQGFMTRRDYDTYMNLFRVMRSYLPMPDLFVCLKAPANVLLQRVRQRNNNYEQPISLQYLMSLNEHYDKWYETLPLDQTCLIEVGNTNFDDPNDPNVQRILELVSGAVERRQNILKPRQNI